MPDDLMHLDLGLDAGVLPLRRVVRSGRISVLSLPSRSRVWSCLAIVTASVGHILIVAALSNGGRVASDTGNAATIEMITLPAAPNVEADPVRAEPAEVEVPVEAAVPPIVAAEPVVPPVQAPSMQAEAVTAEAVPELVDPTPAPSDVVSAYSEPVAVPDRVTAAPEPVAVMEPVKLPEPVAVLEPVALPERAAVPEPVALPERPAVELPSLADSRPLPEAAEVKAIVPEVVPVAAAIPAPERVPPAAARPRSRGAVAQPAPARTAVSAPVVRPEAAAGVALPDGQARAARETLTGRIREAVQAAVQCPAAARMMGQSGKAGVAFDYRDGAVLGGPQLARSSGTRVLDIAALAAVQTARYPAAPPEVLNQVMHLLVWVEEACGG